MTINPRLIWIDFENAPHVWVFKEVITHLRARGFEVVMTARDFSSTIRLCAHLGLEVELLGDTHATGSNLSKLMQVVQRAMALRRFIRRRGELPAVALSHSSRSQGLAAWMLRIPAMYLEDYEKSFQGFYRFPRNLLVPFPIPVENFHQYADKIVHYPGFKEHLYLWNPENMRDVDASVILPDHVNIILRPEGRFSHYRSDMSAVLQRAILDAIPTTSPVNVVLISRDAEQERDIAAHLGARGIRCTVPAGVLNGPALIAHADLVIGGGGTMTREACALHVPSYSFFGGETGAVDAWLEEHGLLTMLRDPTDVARIAFARRATNGAAGIPRDAFDFVCGRVEAMAAEAGSTGRTA